MVERGRVLLVLPQGAGKTRTTIAACEDLAAEFDGPDEPPFLTLLLAAGDLRMQWRDSIQELTDGSTCMVLRNEGPDKRLEMYKKAKLQRPRYLMVGYRTLVTDWKTLRWLRPDCVVADEVTAIKSFTATQSGALKDFPSQFRFGLTGDPVENRADELFSIMEWVDATVLGRADLFDLTYVKRAKTGHVVGYRNLATLNRVMTRSGGWFVKTEDDPDVASKMPVKLPHKIHRIEMQPASAGLYDRIADDLLEELEELAKNRGKKFNLAGYYGGDKDSSAQQGRVASRLLALRMLSAHPLALRASGQMWLDAGPQPLVNKKVWVEEQNEDGSTKRVQRVVRAPRTKPGSAYAAKLVKAGHLDKLTESWKLDALVRKMDAVLDENEDNKLVTFSFFRDILGILGPMYGREAITYLGGMTNKRKYELRQKFQTDPKVRCFLSSDAGGYGLDLPQANHLFNYDTPFSGGRQRQRNTRIRRAASAWAEIQVHDMLHRSTIDEYYHGLTGRKLSLGDAIKSGMTEARDGRVTMSVGSLTEFLTNVRPSDD